MRKNIKANYNFNIEHTNDGSHITYSKDKFGAGLGCGVFILVVIGILPLLSMILRIKDSIEFYVLTPIVITVLIM